MTTTKHDKSNPRPIRKISPSHTYSEIHLQLGRFRQKREARVTAFISVKEENDNSFKIFLTSNLTSKLCEVRKSINDAKSTYLNDCAEDFISDHPKCMLGRVRYTAKGGYVTEETRSSLGHALLGTYVDETGPHAVLFLLNEIYKFDLDNALSAGQRQYYDLEGIWERDYPTMTEEQEFE